MQENKKALDALGVQLVVLSQDRPETIRKTIKKNKLEFPVYSDHELKAALAFGVVFSIDEETVEMYKKYDIDLVGLYGRQKPLMPVPSVFLIGKEGRVRFEYVNPDYRERLKTRVLLAAVEDYL